MAKKTSADASTDRLSSYEALCHKKGQRLTAPRQRVLSILLDQTGPMGAYDVIHAMQALAYDVKPPTVYRALSFLETQGFIHRINSLNAYVLCRHSEADHEHGLPLFMICTGCGQVEEHCSHELQNQLKATAHKSAFCIERAHTELYGQCSSCVAA